MSLGEWSSLDIVALIVWIYIYEATSMELDEAWSAACALVVTYPVGSIDGSGLVSGTYISVSPNWREICQVHTVLYRSTCYDSGLAKNGFYLPAPKRVCCKTR